MTEILKENIPSNAILEVKLDYISKDVAAIKSDIHDIKLDYITRREAHDVFAALRKETEDKAMILKEELAPIKKFVYSLVAIFGVAIIGAILKIVLIK